ncbi:MAG: hypothetical protein AAF525_21250 [Pseudomonadota bacterium]
MSRREFESVALFVAGVEPDNIGSIKSLLRAGFETNGEPDFEGMLYFLKRR